MWAWWRYLGQASRAALPLLKALRQETHHSARGCQPDTNVPWWPVHTAVNLCTSCVEWRSGSSGEVWHVVCLPCGCTAPVADDCITTPQKKYINSKQDPIPWGQHQWRGLAVDSLHWWVLGRVGIVAGVFTLWKVKQPSACWHHVEGPSISFSYRNMVALQLINMCGPLRQVLWKNINVVNIIALISKTIMIF